MSPFFLLAVLAIGALVLGLSGGSGVRAAARSFSFLGFLFFGAVAGASFYGMFRLSGQGGGVLLFLGLPCAFIAWLFWGAFSASREHEEFLTLPAGERRDRTNALLESQIAEHERTLAENTERLKSFWITPKKRKRLREENAHARLMIRGLTQMRPATDGSDATGGHR